MGMPGEIHWSECATREPEKVKAFYSEIVGWTMTAWPMPGGGGDYIVAMQGDRPVAGILPMSGEAFEGIPPHWMTYIHINDVDHAAQQVVELGGEVVRAPWDVPGVGRIAIIKDPGGATVGLMTPAAEPG